MVVIIVIMVVIMMVVIMMVVIIKLSVVGFTWLSGKCCATRAAS